MKYEDASSHYVSCRYYILSTIDPICLELRFSPGLVNHSCFFFILSVYHCQSCDHPYPDPQAGGFQGALQCGKYKPTNVISVSHGGQEADLPASYQERQCNEYMKSGMQVISGVGSWEL